jgi:hypothetical protein
MQIVMSLKSHLNIFFIIENDLNPILKSVFTLLMLKK